jgi:hypothetical protein
MIDTRKARILAVIKNNPGKSSLEISLLMKNVTRIQVSNLVHKLAARCRIENRSETRKVSKWYAIDKVDVPVLHGPSYQPSENYTPSIWHVRDGGNDALQIPSRRGNELVPHRPPISMCVGTLVDGRSLGR